MTGDETDGNTWTVLSDAGEAFNGVERAIERLTERFHTDDVLLCLSEGRNFRYEVDPTYKGNRKGTRKPSSYLEVVERSKAKWPHYSHPGLEADDVLGIFATRDSNTILVSDDKDMKTIPCTLFQQGQLQKIDKATADRWFFYQVLVGDTADGYPGLPGCGPVKAEKILTVKAHADCGDPGCCSANPPLWSRVKDAYEAKGLTEADALKQARLARILRNEDWDAVKKVPILWEPPHS